MDLTFQNGKVLRLIQGDITKIPADAIVNAANSELRGGGGVDGAIHQAGGPEIMRELRIVSERIGLLPAGGAVETRAGSLPARYVFHAVGPGYRDGKHGEPEKLASCYTTCLRMAEERSCRTISFPAISAGVYGYPMSESARIAIGCAREHLLKPDTKVREILLVLWDRSAYSVYETTAARAAQG